MLDLCRKKKKFAKCREHDTKRKAPKDPNTMTFIWVLARVT